MLSRLFLNIALTRGNSGCLTSCPWSFLSSTTSSKYKLLKQKSISQTSWSQEGTRSSFLMGLYVEGKGGIYLKLTEKSEGRKGEIFVNFLDFTKFSAGLKSVHESGFSTEECFSLSDGQDCSIFHMGEEIRIRKKAKIPIESGLVVVSIGGVEQIVQTIKEFGAST